MSSKPMQVKTSSFLDWELSFRGIKPNVINEKYTYKKESVNSIGITERRIYKLIFHYAYFSSILLPFTTFLLFHF